MLEGARALFLNSELARSSLELDLNALKLSEFLAFVQYIQKIAKKCPFFTFDFFPIQNTNALALLFFLFHTLRMVLWDLNSAYTLSYYQSVTIIYM